MILHFFAKFIHAKFRLCAKCYQHHNRFCAKKISYCTLPNLLCNYTDRYYPDGTWEPNLYQFFNRVFNNMDQALPHPFKLDDKNNRIDGTPADESLREAICNTLIHCDWSMMSGVVIERYLDRFVFINPGTMLISVEDFFKGGNSICRNPYLQDMFISMGLGEHLGSGADVIKKGWKDNGWPEPVIC